MVSRVLYISLFVLCMFPLISAPLALLMGFAFSLLFDHPFKTSSGKAVNLLLKTAVVGLGFGMEWTQTWTIGKETALLTFATISIVLVLGYLLGKIFKTDPTIRFLISVGTAICGGSAIAAVAPIAGSDQKSTSISLGVVFLLNSIALLIFPFIGEFLDMSQMQFGIWSAMAIHDTSSVVGAAHAFGDEALTVATTAKLGRVLWIIPISLISAFYFKNKNGKVKIPWFILLFLLAILLHNSVAYFDQLGTSIFKVSKSLLVASLFVIGSGLRIKDIRAAGWPALSLGVGLWIIISTLSIGSILIFY